jgi:hypothetical protein
MMTLVYGSVAWIGLVFLLFIFTGSNAKPTRLFSAARA